jgi:hypothetical protein
VTVRALLSRIAEAISTPAAPAVEAGDPAARPGRLSGAFPELP